MTKIKINQIINEEIMEYLTRSPHRSNIGIGGDFDPTTFDWIGYFNQAYGKMEELNSEFASTSLDELKNEKKIDAILEKYNNVRSDVNKHLHEFTKFNNDEFRIKKEKYEEIKKLINNYITKSHLFGKALQRVKEGIDHIKNYDNQKVF